MDLAYASRIDPAENIQSLISALASEPPREGYIWVYRGQVRDYGLPLIPSAFRSWSHERGETHAEEGISFARVFYPTSDAFTLAMFIRKQKAARGIAVANSGEESLTPFKVTRTDMSEAKGLVALYLGLTEGFEDSDISSVKTLDILVRKEAVIWLQKRLIRTDLFCLCLGNLSFS